MHLSVLIPTRNRAQLTTALLESLVQLDPVPWEWEVIVVDNGSSDNTAELVRQKQADLPIRIRYVLEERPGLHQGRNRGAQEANGDYLAYLDDDMLLAPSWLHGIDMLAEGKADAVVGRIIPKWETEPPEWLTHMCASGVFGPLALLDLGDTAVKTDCFYGCNLFIRRQTVFDFGGFHPDGMPQHLLKYRGDGETGLWLKMRAAGKSLWYSPSAVAYHLVPQSRMTLDYMRKRAYNQGISASFTNLRARNGLYGEPPNGFSHIIREAKIWLRHLQAVMYVQCCWRHYTATTDLEYQIIRVQYETAKGWGKGWKFHRNIVRNDLDIRDHVEKLTYFD